MLLRRKFVADGCKWGLAGLGTAMLPGCGVSPAASPLTDAEEDDDTVTMYDMHAMALYFGGELGPRTGIIRVDYILSGTAVTLTFWHGHGGADHEFTLLPEHYAALKRGERVEIETTQVEGHSHKLFIDPTDPQWRVEGAEPVEVPVDPTQPDTGDEPPADPEDPPLDPPAEGDADRDGITDGEDLCSNTPAGARVHTNGPWAGCAGGQVRDSDR